MKISGCATRVNPTFSYTPWASRVASIHGADIQVLPGSAVAAILGESKESAPVFDEYRKSGVADEEIKLGIVPGMK